MGHSIFVTDAESWGSYCDFFVTEAESRGGHSLFAVLTFGDRARSFDGPNDGLGLVDRLLIFLLGNRICDDAATRLNVPLIAFHQLAAERDAQIEVTENVDIEDAAAINAAAGGL